MTGFLQSQLYDELSFYQKFFQDLKKCQNEVIIESPYITCERMKTFGLSYMGYLDHAKAYKFRAELRNLIWFLLTE